MIKVIITLTFATFVTFLVSLLYYSIFHLFQALYQNLLTMMTIWSTSFLLDSPRNFSLYSFKIAGHFILHNINFFKISFSCFINLSFNITNFLCSGSIFNSWAINFSFLFSSISEYKHLTTNLYHMVKLFTRITLTCTI